MIVRKKTVEILRTHSGISSVIKNITKEKITVDVKKKQVGDSQDEYLDPEEKELRVFEYSFFFDIDKTLMSTLGIGTLEYQILRDVPKKSFGYFSNAKKMTPAGVLACVYGSKSSAGIKRAEESAKNVIAEGELSVAAKSKSIKNNINKLHKNETRSNAFGKIYSPEIIKVSKGKKVPRRSGKDLFQIIYNTVNNSFVNTGISTQSLYADSIMQNIDPSEIFLPVSSTAGEKNGDLSNIITTEIKSTLSYAGKKNLNTARNLFSKNRTLNVRTSDIVPQLSEAVAVGSKKVENFETIEKKVAISEKNN